MMARLPKDYMQVRKLKKCMNSAMLIAKRSFARLSNGSLWMSRAAASGWRCGSSGSAEGSSLEVGIRPIGKLSDLSTYPQICQRVQELTEAGWAATAIARALSDGGYCPARGTAALGRRRWSGMKLARWECSAS